MEGNLVEVALVVIVVGFDKVAFVVSAIEVEIDLVWKATTVFAAFGYV